jgi:hypothetical protein
MLRGEGVEKRDKHTVFDRLEDDCRIETKIWIYTFDKFPVCSLHGWLRLFIISCTQYTKSNILFGNISNKVEGVSIGGNTIEIH